MIHVAGTKGKGSTCALTESILRNCGYSTGFTSSPHLMEVSFKPHFSVFETCPSVCFSLSESTYFFSYFTQLYL